MHGVALTAHEVVGWISFLSPFPLFEFARALLSGNSVFPHDRPFLQRRRNFRQKQILQNDVAIGLKTTTNGKEGDVRPVIIKTRRI